MDLRYAARLVRENASSPYMWSQFGAPLPGPKSDADMSQA